ncbi:ABC transporter substrate-binding protein [Mesorhizobium sp. SARCC-RB16n]|uniref:ABC transporter substrate-binding protein n=1 Tax=Mesorhizobium sp. SARCC-RB16n TaxID=2116687 RepID=UPI00122F00C4|nr:ABC transporter substrate-binding protein [Mesorhizobium sp. SARCC-RB16n]KAA3447998.1 ABC transporter substrate-binding protein [Mesorhizobium sp. SARCC-RB16n]
MTKLAMNRRQAIVGLGTAGAMAALGRPAFAARKVKLGVMRLASHAPSYIACERGYFKNEGLDVEFEFFEAAQPMTVAIASGDADYGVTAMSGGLVSLAQKGAIKVIGGALSEEKGRVGAVILASEEAYQAGLTSPRGLSGKSFGVTTIGSSFHYMCHKIAEANGIPMSEMTLPRLQKVDAIISALSTGLIDAWAIQGSIANKMLAEGAAKQIGLVSDYAPNYQVTTVFTSTNIAADQREQTAAFIRAYSTAIDDYNAAVVDKTSAPDEVDEVAKIIYKYVDSDLPFQDAKAIFVGSAMRIKKGCALALDSVTDQLDWFKAEKMVRETITPEMLFDTSYVETI